MSLQIATACISGKYLESARANQGRISLLREIGKRVRGLGWRPDILLFPGGYFFLNEHVGFLSPEERVKRIAKQPFSSVCQEVSAATGALVVAGVDSVDWQRPDEDELDEGDQFCVAWDGEGIAGIGRKVFPVPGDEAEGLVIYQSDFGSPKRLVKFRGNDHALLCACYDMYGCTETAESLGARSKNIQWIGDGRDSLLERRARRAEVRAILKEELSKWERMVSEARVGLAVVHYFAQKGRWSGKADWQRDGVESASKVLGGRAAFGAAHFEPPLPEPDACVLAAKRGQALQPVKHFYVNEKGKARALVRLFEV